MNKKFGIIIFILAIMFVSFTSFKAGRPSLKKIPIMIPKGDTYASQWEEVASFDKKRLPKSALKIVENIYNQAKASKNGEQIIKALFYKAKYEQSLKENSFIQTLDLFKQEAEKATPANKSIIYSIIAEQYWSYYQNNRWQINQRTNTQGFDDKDIKTWDIRKLIEHATKYYLLSLENIDNLSRTRLNAYSEIIIKGKSSDQNYTEKFRPFLYDFLSHRALDFFSGEEPNITRAKETFSVNNEKYYALGNSFANQKIVIKDSSNLKNYAIVLFQKLTKTHLYDSDKTALIDVEIKRLKFVKANSVLANKESLYFDALNNFYSEYKNNEGSTEILYEIAQVHFNKGSKYSFTKSIEENKDVKGENAIAKQICEKAISKFPNSFGAKQCQTILAKINLKLLTVTTESFASTTQNNKALVSYKNIDKAFFKLVKVDFNTYLSWSNKPGYNQNQNEFIRKKLLGMSPIKSWEESVENDNDFNQHTTEINFRKLEKGHYFLISSNNKNFSTDKGIFNYNSIMVTNIAYFSRSKDNNNTKEFFVTDRESGTPLENVKAEVFTTKYDYTTRQNITSKKGTFYTDKEGRFSIKHSDVKGDRYNSNFYVVFSKDGDILNSRNRHNVYQRHNNTPKPSTQTVLFTDRAIYRPGQKIYFKGIVLKKDGEKSSLKTAYATTVEFLDVNYQKISSVKVTTNEYGSFSGSFTAPDDRLNGMMRLKEKHGQVAVSIEEYKRPKFEVEINPITGTYKLDEKVSVTGFAKTYSGAPLDGADVTYRVIRNGRFPFWCWYRWGYMPTSPEVEITNGTAKTNDKGVFKIDFLAQSDKTVNNKFSPTFTYTVYVDVIDINGETHSANSYVSVSDKALVLSTNLEGSILKKDFKNISINSTNLNGEFEPAKVDVVVWSLKELNKHYKERKWSAPEKQKLSESAFHKLFPLDSYADEDDFKNWEKKTKIISKTINTTKDNKEISIENLLDWKQETYFIHLTATDKYGKKVEEMKYFRLIDEKSKQANQNVSFELTDIKTTCEPGEKAAFLLSTAYKNVKVYYEIERKGKVTNSEWLTLDNEQRKISIPITENDRGNISVHIAFVKHNKSYSYSKTIIVPHTNKKLDIEFSTFRNKLLPGQEEQWEVKIKGAKGEKVVAEMMAGMYDASLDAFRPNAWNLSNLWKNYYTTIRWETSNNFTIANGSSFGNNWNSYAQMPYRNYDVLNQFGYYYNSFHRGNSYGYYSKGNRGAVPEMAMSITGNIEADGEFEDEAIATETIAMHKAKKPSPSAMNGKQNASPPKEQKENNNTDKDKSFGDIKARTNFNETAFFFPQLATDKKGNICFTFTVPESLTKWKFMSLAHTKDLKVGTMVSEAITQKDLMVYPNAPRFFRENDEMVFSTKIVNISKEDLSGEARVYFFNSLTNKDITKEVLKGAMFEVFKEGEAVFPFTLPAEKSTVVKWKLNIPEAYSAITYKVVAKAGNFSDGEEKPVPVLTNRMMVTESMPLPIRGHQNKTFTFDKLVNNKSTTLKNHKLTLEFTSNPAWYAVQALPYLMEYPYQCAEQTFSRYYANAIATNIANSSPKIKEVFKAWENSSPEAFLSNLEKNQELKAVILEETPWVLQAQNESERKKRVGLLFNLNKMSKELNKALNRLQKMQKPSGGWPWFEGMRESRYITQHIATGLGHLDKLGVKEVRLDKKTYQMLKKAIQYLDVEIMRDYQHLKLYKDVDLTKDHIGNMQIQYLYTRSFFPEILMPNNNEAYNYYFGQAKQYWTNKSQYMQAMISLTMNRTNEVSTAKDIIKSIKEYSIESEEMGMYWKSNAGYYWYQAPIETQAMFIEAFAEVTNDQASVESMKVWLLKQKQTQDWKTTKATTEACYALLLQGNDWLASDNMVEIQVGNEIIDAKNNPDIKVEAGTGYFKTSWNAEQITPEMGTVKVNKKDDGVSWGAMYWQYFEQLDKITPAKTPLSLEKKLFLVKNTDKGEVIEPINTKTKLKVGDKIRVRVVLRTDRDMEYIHLKDMRASGFEPTNVFSGYRYQDGLGYYETTKDASTNFFISWLSKGTYVFEYDLRANIEGNFSNGISSIQCMYAPEFASHSEGVRVSISGK